MSPMRDGRTNKQTTSEDRATQLLICEPLSFAIIEGMIIPDRRVFVQLQKVVLSTSCVLLQDCKQVALLVPGFHWEMMRLKKSKQTSILVAAKLCHLSTEM